MRLLLAFFLAFSLSAPAGEPTHPRGELWKRVKLGGRPFAVDVWGSVAFVGVLDIDQLVRVDLTTGETTGSLKVGQVPSAVHCSADGKTVWVANQHGQTLEEVDAVQLKSLRRLSVNASPGVMASRSTGPLYLALLGGGLQEVEPTALKLARRVKNLREPNGLLLNADGSRLYVSEASGGGVSIVDPKTLSITARLKGVARAQGLALTANGDLLWVADEAGTLARFDTRTLKELGRSPAQQGFALAATADGKQLYLAQTRLGQLSVVDSVVHKEVAVLKVGGQPRRLGFSADGTTAIVANEAGWVDLIR